MPDISPTAARRDPQDDSFYDPPPDLSKKNEVVRINAPTLPGLTRAVDPAPPTLPETPAAKLNVRAFANPALGGKPKEADDTKEKTTDDAPALCALVREASGTFAGSLDPAALSSCVRKDGACLSPEDAELVAALCTPRPAPPAPPFDGPTADVETGTGNSLDTLEKSQQTALAQQLMTEKSVATDPLAALVAPAVIAAGATRETLYNETRLADGGWAMLSARAQGLAAAHEGATLVDSQVKSGRK